MKSLLRKMKQWLLVLLIGIVETTACSKPDDQKEPEYSTDYGVIETSYNPNINQ